MTLFTFNNLRILSHTPWSVNPVLGPELSLRDSCYSYHWISYLKIYLIWQGKLQHLLQFVWKKFAHFFKSCISDYSRNWFIAKSVQIYLKSSFITAIFKRYPGLRYLKKRRYFAIIVLKNLTKTNNILSALFLMQLITCLKSYFSSPFVFAYRINLW